MNFNDQDRTCHAERSEASPDAIRHMCWGERVPRPERDGKRAWGSQDALASLFPQGVQGDIVPLPEREVPSL
jgi:hypothetical protein